MPMDNAQSKEGKSVYVGGSKRMLRRNQTMFLPVTRPDMEELAKEVADHEHLRGSTEIKLDDNKEDELQIFRLQHRRPAFVDTKSLIGEVDDTESQHLSVQHSSSSPQKLQTLEPQNSLYPGSLKHKRKSVLQKQQTVAEFSLRTVSSNSPQDSDIKKRSGNAFLKLMERKPKPRDSVSAIGEAFQHLKPSFFHDKYIQKFRTFDFKDYLPNLSEGSITTSERKRREAVWELFISELNFLNDHIMVLKHCFLEPLKSLQVDGYLMFVEPQELFGNLDELCYVSYSFCRDLVDVLVNESTATASFGKTNDILEPMKNWSQRAKDGEIFHDYCLNYDSALNHLERLRKHDEFLEYEKCCQSDHRCRRLQLTDLLIAPLQHYAKIPLLLGNIRRHTEHADEKQELSEALGKVENSLRHLEEKMTWLKNFERLHVLQSQLIWPAITDIEPRLSIPEFLRGMLSQQPCEHMLANPKRQLILEGHLTVNDGGKSQEMYAFLFDDFLLFTRIKKAPKKKSLAENNLFPRSPTEGGLYLVHRQPVALDRFTIHDIGTVEATANGLKHAFVLILLTRFQQITGVYIIQATTECIKAGWLSALCASQENFQKMLKEKLYQIRLTDLRTNKHSKLIYVTPVKSEEHSWSRSPRSPSPSNQHQIEDSDAAKLKASSSLSITHSPCSQRSPLECTPLSSLTEESTNPRVVDYEEEEAEISASPVECQKLNSGKEKHLISESPLCLEDSGSDHRSERDASLPWPRTLSFYKTINRDSRGNQSLKHLPGVTTPPGISQRSVPAMDSLVGIGGLLDHSRTPVHLGELAYELNDQSPFSPPLSPILHTPELSVEDFFKQQSTDILTSNEPNISD